VRSAGSGNMVNRARQILKERLQGSRIVGIEGRGALGAEFVRRLFEAFAIASGEDDAGALGAGTPSGFKAYARAAAKGIVEAVALMTPPIETISSPVRRSRLFLNLARHRPHPDLLLRRIRRSIIREILANAPTVGSKSIDKWCVGRELCQSVSRGVWCQSVPPSLSAN
jgi:hypothetical protein